LNKPRLAVMQPYFMPYIGYWQLLAAADRFIALDDVAFTPRGWVNRNRIVVHGAAHLFTLPVRRASHHRLISELELAVDAAWLRAFRLTLEQSYRKAPCFEETMDFLEPLLSSCGGPLLPFLLLSMQAVARHFGIVTPVSLASAVDPEHRQRGQDRILELCRRAGACEYINLPGGRDLYDSAAFASRGVRLGFIVPQERPYPQLARQWLPWLSIMDMLMQLGHTATRQELSGYRLDATGSEFPR